MHNSSRIVKMIMVTASNRNRRRSCVMTVSKPIKWFLYHWCLTTGSKCSDDLHEQRMKLVLMSIFQQQYNVSHQCWRRLCSNTRSTVYSHLPYSKDKRQTDKQREWEVESKRERERERKRERKRENKKNKKKTFFYYMQRGSKWQFLETVNTDKDQQGSKYRTVISGLRGPPNKHITAFEGFE